jgi:HlyD family secretion protein
MEKNKDDKKHDEGIKAEGFPTFDEKKNTAEGVKTQAQASNTELSEQEAKAKRRKIRQAKRLALIGSMLILVAVVAAMAIWGIMHLKPSDKSIQGQADCEVVRVSGKLAGRLVELYVKEGDYVHKGQRLAKIYSSTTDATYSKAKEMKNVAANQNLKVERGTRYEIIESARKMVDQAKSARQQAIAAEEITRKTFERTNNLYNEGVVSEQKRDEAKAALDAATAAVGTANAAVEAAEAQLQMAQNGAQAEDKAASRGMENVAQATVREVEALLEDEYLIAPCDGEITSIYPHVGELVIMGSPIMTIANIDDMWAAFSVREEKLNDLPMGKVIDVEIPALDNKKAQMKVFYIHDMGSYATWSATKAYGDYDSKTFEVKARPVNPIPNFRPGMSVILK